MREDLFNELMESIREGGAILRGEIEPSRRTTAADLGLVEAEVRAAREQLGLTRPKFAALLGISHRTLEGWEQGRREPEGAARVLIHLAKQNPTAVLDAVASMGKPTLHVVPEGRGGKGWKVTQGGKTLSTHKTEASATKAARSGAKAGTRNKSTHGGIRVKSTHGRSK